MALKNGVSVVLGHRRLVTYSSTGSLTGDTFYTGIPKNRITIRNLTSEDKGDFRTPNSHRYTILSQSYWHGTTLTRDLNGRVVNVVEGLQSKTLADNLPADFAFSDTAYNRCLSEFNEMIRGDLDVLVDLSQWRQVVDMINIRKNLIGKMAHTVNTLTGRVNHLERISRARIRRILNRGRTRDTRMNQHNNWYARRARELANEIASRRLEYVYGWAPLAGTIVGLGEEFCDLQKPWNRYQEVRARGLDRHSYTNVVNGTEIRVHVMRYRCQLAIWLLPPEDVTLAQLSRISSLNPISLVYENIPFSFVVDWFIDIGDWLRDTESSFINSNRFVSGYKTEGYLGEVELREHYDTETSYRYIRASVNKRCFRRSKLSAFPFPRAPRLKPVLNDSRLLNAAALLQVNSRRLDAFVRKWL